MSTPPRVYPLPPDVRNRLDRLVERQAHVRELIEAVIQTASESLGVPDGYALRDINIGFERSSPNGEES